MLQIGHVYSIPHFLSCLATLQLPKVASMYNHCLYECLTWLNPMANTPHSTIHCICQSTQKACLWQKHISIFERPQDLFTCRSCFEMKGTCCYSYCWYWAFRWWYSDKKWLFSKLFVHNAKLKTTLCESRMYNVVYVHVGHVLRWKAHIGTVIVGIELFDGDTLTKNDF